MNDNLLTAMGVLGNVLLLLSYLPQIKKTLATKRAEDLSITMWTLTAIGDVLLMIYAILTNDTIFTALFTIFTIENCIILYLTFKYGKPKQS